MEASMPRRAPRRDPITNSSTGARNKWLELDYAGLADAVNKGIASQPTLFSDLITDKPDLGKLRDLGRKVVIYTGLVDDAIPPAGNINYHERVVAAMGGHAEVQKFMRMYLLPGSAHSSQGRAYTVSGKTTACRCRNCPVMPTRRRRASRTSSSRRWWIGSRKTPRPVKSC